MKPNRQGAHFSLAQFFARVVWHRTPNWHVATSYHVCSNSKLSENRTMTEVSQNVFISPLTSPLVSRIFIWKKLVLKKMQLTCFTLGLCKNWLICTRRGKPERLNTSWHNTIKMELNLAFAALFTLFVWLTTKLVQRSPSWHHTFLSGSKDVRWCRETGGLDVGTEGERTLQLQHGHINVGGRGVVVWRHCQCFDVDCFGLRLFSAHQTGPHQGCPLFGVVGAKNRKQSRMYGMAEHRVQLLYIVFIKDVSSGQTFVSKTFIFPRHCTILCFKLHENSLENDLNVPHDIKQKSFA